MSISKINIPAIPQSQVDQMNYKALKLQIIELKKTLSGFRQLARETTVDKDKLQKEIETLKTQIDALNQIANQKRD